MRPSRRWSAAALMFALRLAAEAAAAAEPFAAWQYSQPVTVAPPGLIRFSVPLATLDAARSGLEDVRILDASGSEVPFDLLRPVPPAVLTAAPRRSAIKVETNATVATLETGLAVPVVGVTVQTPARDFLKAVRIEASSDGRLWATVADGQPVFALTNGATQLRVNFPAGLWPHLRVTLDDRRAAPVPVTGITLHPEPGEVAPDEPLGLEITERAETPRETRLTLRLAGGNLVLADLTLVVADPLFSRRVTLAQRTIRGNEVQESAVASGFLYRLALEGRPAVSNVTFAVDAPVQSRELLLTIHNDGQPPLNVSAVTAKRRPVFALLVNDRPGPLQLLAGNAQCPAPKHDLTALRRDGRTVPLASATAGPLTANPKFTGPAAPDVLATGTGALDLGQWRFRKPVRLVGPGIQQLELDREVLARCATNFADLRVVTAGRPVPFILDRPATSDTPAATARLLFRAAGGDAPALYYGNAQATPPRLALESAAREIFSAPRVQATLGPEEAVTASSAGQRPSVSPGGLRWGIGLVVLAIVASLLALARRARLPAGN